MCGDAVWDGDFLQRPDVKVIVAFGLGSQRVLNRQQPVGFVVSVLHIV